MRNFFYRVRWWLSVALLLCLAITLMKYSQWMDHKLFTDNKQPSTVIQQPAQAVAQPTPTKPPTSTPAPTDVRVQLAEANASLSEASIYASEALKEVRSWQREIEPLKNLTAGEAIADQEDLIEKLAYVFREKRITASELQETTTRIEALRLKVGGLTKQSNPTALSTAEISEISQLHAQCKKANEEWELAVQRGLALKRSIENSTTPNRPSKTPPSVGDKIKDADAKAAIADLEAQIERDKKQKAEDRKRAAQLAEQKRQQEQQEAELLEKATSAEVTAILAPFLEPRDIQPRMSGSSVKLRKTVDKQPMSLSAIQGMNALAPSIDGLKRLAKLGGHRKLSAPRWAVHSQPGNWSDDDREMLKKAQQLLREYGPILVKAGKLSK